MLLRGIGKIFENQQNIDRLFSGVVATQNLNGIRAHPALGKVSSHCAGQYAATSMPLFSCPLRSLSFSVLV